MKIAGYINTSNDNMPYKIAAKRRFLLVTTLLCFLLSCWYSRWTTACISNEAGLNSSKGQETGTPARCTAPPSALASLTESSLSAYSDTLLTEHVAQGLAKGFMALLGNRLSKGQGCNEKGNREGRKYLWQICGWYMLCSSNGIRGLRAYSQYPNEKGRKSIKVMRVYEVCMNRHWLCNVAEYANSYVSDLICICME